MRDKTRDLLTLFDPWEDLNVPRVRQGDFHPKILPYRRRTSISCRRTSGCQGGVLRDPLKSVGKLPCRRELDEELERAKEELERLREE